MQNKIVLSFTFLFFILVTIFSLPIPFFWDGTFFSEAALYFFENNSSNFIPSQQVDTGGFPLYSTYLALAWKVFNKSLFVSHLALLPFLIGIVIEYFKLAKRFLNPRALLFAMMLLIFEPTFITQSILMGYDLLMIYFFLLSLNALIKKTFHTKAPLAFFQKEGRGVSSIKIIFQHKIYTLALIFLCLSSVRGSILGVSLFILDVVLNYSSSKKIKTLLLSYAVPFTILLLWAFYHYYKTGWYLFSPLRENSHETTVSVTMMFRQLFFITWKIIDFGRITLWLFLISAALYFHKKQTNHQLKTILKVIFIPLLTLSLFMIPLANPIGHKYFITIFLCLNIGVCFLIQQLPAPKTQLIFILIFFLSLLSGNFWLYPEKYGNGWDSSLKVLPYFQLKNQMDEFIKTQKINPEQIGTQFPLIADKKFSHLSDTSFHYKNVWRGPISTYPYFLFSNVINSDIPNQIENTKNTWQLIKSIKSGEIYIHLYKEK